MKLHRIGEKIVDSDRLTTIINDILHRRAIGATQQEVAMAMGLERSFVSHLEGIGEVRRGKRIALVGFPVANKEELTQIAHKYAVDLVYLLSEDERREFVRTKSGAQMFNELLEMLAILKDYDAVIFLGSDKRISNLAKILDREIIGVNIGGSPIKKDKAIKPDVLIDILSKLTADKELNLEAYSKRKFRIFKKKP